jgi:sterol desaturase/sphingolipid hydroxylase (fatty acid hydroxylase superfamily)
MNRSDQLKASPPMFGTPFLDRFTRVHWSVPLFMYLPLVGFFLVLGLVEVGVWSALGLVAGGYATWTLTEYWLHRVVFHYEPEEGIGARIHWMIHGVHHDHPNDPLRLVMPPSASLPLATLFVVAFWLILGGSWWLPFSAGFLGGYLAYDMIHYYVHHNRPTSRAGKKLRELHMRHHFQDHERGFGVSAPWWDQVFGTAPGRRPR